MIQIITNEENKENLVIHQFDICWANLPLAKEGSSVQSGYRPVIIIQNDIGNKFSPTAIVIPMTSSIKKMIPTHIYLQKSFGLKNDSTILAEQITTIDKSRITKKIGYISDSNVQQAIWNAIIVALKNKYQK